MCPVTIAGRALLASGSNDQTVRIWDPATGQQQAVLAGHQGPVNGVCPVTADGRDLIASGSDDQTVRIWDPATGVCVLTIPVHYQAGAVASVGGLLVVGLGTGLLAIELTLTR